MTVRQARPTMPDESEPSPSTWTSPQMNMVTKLVADWDWMRETASFRWAQGNSNLRENVRFGRGWVEGVLWQVQDFSTRIDDTVKWAQTPSERTQDLKTRALELRRKYPGLLVSSIAAISILPTIKAGPRAIGRNLVLGGGTAVALLYPELVFRAAPLVKGATSRVEARIKSNLGTGGD